MIIWDEVWYVLKFMSPEPQEEDLGSEMVESVLVGRYGTTWLNFQLILRYMLFCCSTALGQKVHSRSSLVKEKGQRETRSGRCSFPDPNKSGLRESDAGGEVASEILRTSGRIPRITKKIEATMRLDLAFYSNSKTMTEISSDTIIKLLDIACNLIRVSGRSKSGQVFTEK
jgi:hypothetical protein